MSNQINKNNTAVLVFGELSTTLLTATEQKNDNKNRTKIFSSTQDMPAVFFDTQSITSSTGNNQTSFGISDNGTGANQEVGMQLMKDKIDQVLELQVNDKKLVDFQTYLIQVCIGGGTAGSAFELGHKLNELGKKVIFFCYDLMTSDVTDGDRLTNATHAKKQLTHFSHTYLTRQSGNLLDIANTSNSSIELVKTLFAFRNADNNDLTKLFSSNTEFQLKVGSMTTNSKSSETLADKVIVNSLKSQALKFVNESGTVSNLLVCASTPCGEANNAKDLKNAFNPYFVENPTIKTAIGFASESTSTFIIVVAK